MERVHRTINAIFTKMVDENQRNWSELTPYHYCTTFSPFYLLYLREARIPIYLAMANVGEAMPADWDDYVSKMRSRMEQAFQAVLDRLGQAFQRAKQAYDDRAKKLKFKVDDLVWFFCLRKRPRLGQKWQLLTTGPWQIQKVLNSVNYVIRPVGGCDRRVVHVDRLQRYHEVVQDDTNSTSRPRPEGDKLICQP